MELADLRRLMTELAHSRPIFHSEADFQHALAWQLHLEDPTAKIRLERRFRSGQHIDLSLVLHEVRVGMELKYPTRRFSTRSGDEPFSLLHHSAQDLRRWDVVWDLVRLEGLVLANERLLDVGFIVALTNDQAYWKASGRSDTIDAAFRFHQGARLGGTMLWDSKAGKGTIHNRDKALELTGEYLADWADYSQVTQDPGGRFRYLAIEVRPPVPAAK